MKKKLMILVILNIFAHFLFSETIIIDKFITDNLELSMDNRDVSQLSIKEKEYSVQPETDILLHFNDNFEDSSGNYTVKSEYNNLSNVEKKLGKSSAFFLKDKGISYESNGDSFFTPGRIIGDFTIEFWALPTIINQDTILFSWKGVNKVQTDFISQKIKCFIEDRRVVWEFENFFIPADFQKHSIKLTSKSRLIPKQWNHYLIRYNSENGLIEFLLNGTPEAVKYTTKTEKEEFNVYTPYIGNFSKNEIIIGSKFRGFIDEFRISEKFIETPYLESFYSMGSFYSDVYKLDNNLALLESIIPNNTIYKETEIIYQYRFSNIPFLANNTDLTWIALEDNSKLNLEGKYIQIRGELYSNGGNTISPKVENITIEWSKRTPPPPPQLVRTTSESNSITVKWSSINHFDIDGYYLYYGEKSKNYNYMIDTGKNTTYTVNNLESNKIYYFSIRSYYKDSVSEYSMETYNRPK